VNISPNIPLLGQDKSKGPDQVLEGITARPLKEGTVEIPVGMKDGKPQVGKIGVMHLAVQFRFVLLVPLPLNDKEQSKELLQMVMESGLNPEWQKAHAALQQIELNLKKGAELAVKEEHAARIAAEAERKHP